MWRRSAGPARGREAAPKSRTQRYEARASDDDRLGALSERLVADLRGSIRAVVARELFTPEWLELVAALDRIATVVATETSFSRDESKDATLWDGDEAALRFILEDGKANLMIRMLADFKSAQRAALSARPGTDEGSTGSPLRDDAMMQDAAATYEASLCTILSHAVSHAEVVDTVDLKVVLTLIRDALVFAIDPDKPIQDDLPRSGKLTLESAAYPVLESAVRRAVDTSEDRAMTPILDLGILRLALQHTVSRWGAAAASAAFSGESKSADAGPATFAREEALANLRAIAVILDTENYDIHQKAHLGDAQELLQQLEPIVDAVGAMEDERAALRPLTDELKRMRRRALK